MTDHSPTQETSQKTAAVGDSALAAIAKAISGRKLPPVERWNPPWCGHMDMRIARDGTWYYQGSPIGRKPLVKLFSTVLRREPDGSFVLVTPVERLGITVDDAPFVAVEMQCEGAGRDRQIAFRLNTDDFVLAGPEHPIRITVDADTGEPSPYVHVRGGLEALISRSVFYEMVELALHEPTQPHGEDSAMLIGLWSGGTFFPIGDPEAA